MGATPPTSVGLGGDGDELFAIADVERAFGVKLDYSDAPQWHTAGDVFSSLQQALPANGRDEPALWARFTEALSAQTGVDPATIQNDSPLLSQSRVWVHIANASSVVWITAAATMIGLVVWGFLNS